MMWASSGGGGGWEAPASPALGRKGANAEGWAGANNTLSPSTRHNKPQAVAASFPGDVHSAVSAGKSAEEVRRAIEERARALAGSIEQAGRAAAVNEPAAPDAGKKKESSLQAAIRLRRPDLVSLLLEHGASVRGVDCGPEHGYDHDRTPLAVCVVHGDAGGVRALLRSGQHDPRATFTIDLPWRGPCCPSYGGATAAHLCLFGPARSPSRAPRLEALEVLVREGGADVDARDERGQTPLMLLSHAQGDHAERALDLLLRLGADPNARSWSARGDPRSGPDESPLTALRCSRASRGRRRGRRRHRRRSCCPACASSWPRARARRASRTNEA